MQNRVMVMVLLAFINALYHPPYRAKRKIILYFKTKQWFFTKCQIFCAWTWAMCWTCTVTEYIWNILTCGVLIRIPSRNTAPLCVPSQIVTALWAKNSLSSISNENEAQKVGELLKLPQPEKQQIPQLTFDPIIWLNFQHSLKGDSWPKLWQVI